MPLLLSKLLRIAFFAYVTNYLIDLKHAVIVDVEAMRATRTAATQAVRTMINRLDQAFPPLLTSQSGRAPWCTWDQLFGERVS